MTSWKAVLAIGAALMAAPMAHAATSYYIADCQDGAVAGCVPGNDANSGTSPDKAWRSTARAREVARKLQPGDRILFARGGAWKQASLAVTMGQRHTNDNPIWIDSYKTAWSVDVRPILPLASGAKALVSLSSEDPARSAAGAIVRNLEFRGVGGTGLGVLIGNGVTDVVMDRLIVSRFSVGIQCDAGSKRVRLLYSTVTDNRAKNVRWDCEASTMEGSKVGEAFGIHDAGDVADPGPVASGIDRVAPAAPSGFTVR